MIKTSILASAIWLGFATMAMAQSTAPGTPKSPASALQRCEGMTGTALEQCKREAAPGKSEDAASRAGGASQVAGIRERGVRRRAQIGWNENAPDGRHAILREICT